MTTSVTTQAQSFEKTEDASSRQYLAVGSALSGILEAQGCFAADWNRVSIHRDTDYTLIRNTRFYGDVTIGLLSKDAETPQGIFDAVISNSRIGDGCYISCVRGALDGCTIGNNVTIVDVGRISFESADTLCGIGTAVGVLDETGSRPVYIYPGLDAQMAALMAWKPRWTDDVLFPMLQEMWSELPSYACIGDGSSIRGVGLMLNVGVGAGVTIEGASRLANGLIINNSPTSRPFTFVGSNVDAENFIIEDAKVMSGALLRNCYVGQGTVLDKGFTAHDSLFFANCSCENGEACALFAGPYTVSMHKSSLLIGTMTSFMNAGSGTNSSNHKYKLGPVHWGLMERGVKTSSDSYVMWGGRIGAFSLLMGSHKKHPETSKFPFSYLFSDPKGGTIVVPGVMLRSCGLARDAIKWPSRDNRKRPKVPLHDRISFDVLNPITVGSMMQAVELIDSMLSDGAQPDGFYYYNGLRFSHNSLVKGREFYEMAILKYIHNAPADMPPAIDKPEQWIDLGGLPVPRSVVNKVCKAENLEEMKTILDETFSNYATLEAAWKASAMTPKWRSLLTKAPEAIARLDKMIEADRATTLQTMSDHAAFLRD